jgi:hypothetical protein
LTLPLTFKTDRDGRGAQAGAARVDRDRGMDVTLYRFSGPAMARVFRQDR